MIFRKINRFSGEYYQWDSLESRSENCKFNFLNGKLMNKEEKEDFQYMINNRLFKMLSASGQFLYQIVEN